eukprot:gb/GECG01016417.1/.p1 GENE.gb/GECG01016417.1/~~gb/GECG01016417.1/.p1  ORF type:complete len:345 (+),score=35.98 gb/GECG01016417.1/:1-1035(+)
MQQEAWYAAAGGVVLTSTALYGLRKYFAGGVNPHRNVDLRQKVAIVTGANTGIGYWTAWELARLGCEVILACRSAKRAEDARTRMLEDLQTRDDCFDRAHLQDKVKFMELDLSDLDNVRTFAKNFKAKYNHLDLLINNAGVMMPLQRQTTKQGYELQLGTNHLGHFLLTRELFPVLKAASHARVVNVSSKAHERGKIYWGNLNFEKEGSYSPMDSYSQSKLANVLFTKELARRTKGTGVVTTSLHPGVVETELTRYLQESTMVKLLFPLSLPVRKLVFKDSWQGAQTSLYCALSPEGGQEAYSGLYFSDCKVKDSPNPHAHDEELDRRFWLESSRLLGLSENLE